MPSIDFTFISGNWLNSGFSAGVDDEANSSTGKTVNGVLQYEWDLVDSTGGLLYNGVNNWIYFIPGTASDNGTWYHSYTSTGGSVGTRNGRIINFGTNATFNETHAFQNGLVPPAGGGSDPTASSDGSVTSKKVFSNFW